MNEVVFLLCCASIIYAIGLLGVIIFRNIISILLAIELLFNASNILFITFAKLHHNSVGYVFIMFILFIAAVEAGVGLSLILNIYRNYNVVNVNKFIISKG